MSSLQINISNVNAKGDVVLNDQRLFDLVYWYPFLYNPRVYPQNDKDYEDWAWQSIAEFFNEGYKGFGIAKMCTAAELKARWELHKPILNTLKNARDIIPESLRLKVEKLCPPDNETMVEMRPRQISKSEKVILDHLEMVQCLSKLNRKSLEAEIMELILSEEVESRASKKLSAADEAIIEKEYIDFLKTIRIKDFNPLKRTPKTESETAPNMMYDNEYSLLGNEECDTSELDIAEFDIESILSQKMIVDNTRVMIPDMKELQQQPPKPSTTASPPLSRLKKEPTETQTSATTSQNLPKVSPKISTNENYVQRVPLKVAKKFIRKCCVRIKMLNANDLVPRKRKKRRRSHWDR